MNTPDHPPALPAACPNCSAPVFGPYCAQCGQETVISTLTLREFGHEYLQSFVTLEGRLWHTLWLLFLRPGKLTVEFLQGRRRRYVRPLPLYFSSSFILFLVLALFPSKFMLSVKNDGPPPPSGVSFGAKPQEAPITFSISPASPASAGGATSKFIEHEEDWPHMLRPLADKLNTSYERLNADPDYGSNRMRTSVIAKLPYAVFVLVPIFALSTRLVYRRRRRSYAEHVLFALHLHSFLFLTTLAAYVLLSDGLIAAILAPVWTVYLVMALRTVFGGRLWPQVSRALLLAWMHLTVLGIVMILVLAVSFLLI